ncbi:hypothetical protein [Aquimarina mytili]|uniref:Uncharacterized protein n=1 Tax=Aquimarina mytili TaxID=874423 RepID=A0A937D6C0_9FLAO|nr:hypothetical protein [Aquimarina mytili]MBL0684234.1 hypothetical protein [Aquimarina mytili]
MSNSEEYISVYEAWEMNGCSNQSVFDCVDEVIKSYEIPDHLEVAFKISRKILCTKGKVDANDLELVSHETQTLFKRLGMEFFDNQPKSSGDIKVDILNGVALNLLELCNEWQYFLYGFIFEALEELLILKGEGKEKIQKNFIRIIVNRGNKN